MYIKSIWFGIMTLFAFTIHAQIIDLNGTVTGTNGNPIADVAISLAGQSVTAQTDADGKYALISVVGITHSIKNNGVTSLQFKGNAISFLLSRNNQRVRIDVFSVNGKCLQTVVDKSMQRGAYTFPLFTTSASSQMYLIAFTVNGQSTLLKRVLLAGAKPNNTFHDFKVGSGQEENCPIVAKKTLVVDTLRAVQKGYKRAEKVIDSYEGTHDFVLEDAVYVVEVSAWSMTNSGVYAEKGDSIKITATGSWNYNGSSNAVGPEGTGVGPDGFGSGTLGLRPGKYFERIAIGAAKTVIMPRSGYLWFFQSGGASAFDQQTGSVTVTIEGGDSGSTVRPEGILRIYDDPRFDIASLDSFSELDSLIPVYFETDSPDDPVVQNYINKVMGDDPIAYMHLMKRAECAVYYRNYDAFPDKNKDRTMRIVHYIGEKSWDELGRPPYIRDGREYWDFSCCFKPSQLADLQHYGRWGTVLTTLLHETGHVLNPQSGTNGVPAWLCEALSELGPFYFGDYTESGDNPEGWMFPKSKPYCDGYTPGFHFIDWINQQYPGFYHDLADYIAEHGDNNYPGSEIAFEEITGKSVSTLNDEYLTYYNITLSKPVSDCNFPETEFLE